MIKDFVTYLKQERSSLVQAWIKKFNETTSGYQKINLDQLTGSTSEAFDAFCDTIENDDFNLMEAYLERMTKDGKFKGISFAETQQAFRNVTYILFPILTKRYHGDNLLAILIRVNHVIDMIIFYLNRYFQESHAQKLKNYANKLEEEVKKRTLELEESRSNYQILFEEISDGCFVNQGGRIVFANKAFCEMHAYERKELIGKKCEKLIADDSRDSVMERFYQHLKGLIPFETYIYCRQDRNGQSFPTENRVKLIKYHGKPAVLGLCIDIAERLEMEQKIKQKDRLALIGRLSTSIAHEIRNPLSAIQVNIQILMDRLKLEGNDLRRLQIAHEQSIQLENIVSQMMDFAKPIKLNYNMTSIHGLIDQSVDVFEDRINEKNISLFKKFDPTLPDIMVDKEKMIEAISNVLINAIEAFDGTKKDKSIEFKAKTTTYHGKECLRLSIIDNGVGIHPDDKKNIFEPFFTKGKKGGVGLGLSIVKKILDAHNGHIQIRNEEMNKIDFSLIIPVEISQ
jgi:PAS domain S-box-containing protein